MRQVPPLVISSCSTRASNFIPHVLWAPFATIMLVVFSRQLLPTVYSFLFFAHNSPLFNSGISFASRSWYYGLVQAAASLGDLIASLLLVSVSDYWGRKPVLTIASVGMVLLALCGLSALYWQQVWLLLFAVLVGCCLDGSKTTGLACVADQVGYERKVVQISYLQGSIALGACLGPVLGGHLAQQSAWHHIPYAWPFIASALAAILSFIIILSAKETSKNFAATNSSQRDTQAWRRLLPDLISCLQQRSLLPLLLLLIFAQMSWGLFYEFMPAILKNVFSFSVAQVGTFMGMIAFWLIAAAFLLMPWLKRFCNHMQIITVAALVELLGITLALLASENTSHLLSQTVVWFAAALVAIGDVLIYSVLINFFSNSVPSDQQGKVVAVTAIAVALTWSGMGVFGGWITAHYMNGALWIDPLGILLLILLLLFCRQQKWFKALG